MKRILVLLYVFFVAVSLSAAQPYTYTLTRAEGIGEQLRSEILAIPGFPQEGVTVEQNLRTGRITVRYFSMTVNLTVDQRNAAQTVINNHIPVVSGIGSDPPELLLQKTGYVWRHWDELTAAQKDQVTRALLVVAMRGWGRFD